MISNLKIKLRFQLFLRVYVKQFVLNKHYSRVILHLQHFYNNFVINLKYQAIIDG